MIEDSIVEEVRRIRDDYAKRFNYDIEAMFKDLHEREAVSGRDVVSFPPKPVDEHLRPTAQTEEREQSKRAS
ncbi:MAG: hypothetical protein WD768_22855 [Phycisphaeraceae bacterium]